jgi:hypothetical protein
MRNSIALGLKLERIRIDEVIFDITNLSCRDVIKNKSNVNPFIFHLKPFKRIKLTLFTVGKITSSNINPLVKINVLEKYYKVSLDLVIQ